MFWLCLSSSLLKLSIFFIPAYKSSTYAFTFSSVSSESLTVPFAFCCVEEGAAAADPEELETVPGTI